MKIIGVSDEITVCDCCGKTNLKMTIVLENETGDILHYGSVCAGAATFGGGKTRKKGEIIAAQARARSRVAHVIDAIRAALPQGVEAAKEAGKALLTNGAVHWSNGVPGEFCDFRAGTDRQMTVTISGFQSWGVITVQWAGGREEIALETV